MALTFPSAIFLLETRLSLEQLAQIQSDIPNLTTKITDAKLVIGKVPTIQRAQLELRGRGIWTEEIQKEIKTRPNRRRGKAAAEKDIVETDCDSNSAYDFESSISSLETVNDDDDDDDDAEILHEKHDENTIKVVKLAWVEDSLKAGILLPIDQKYLVYEGRKVPKPRVEDLNKTKKRTREEEILERAKADSFSSGYMKHENDKNRPSKRPTWLLRETTSEHDDPSRYPQVPPCLQQPYSCCRSTPMTCPNDAFIALLKKLQRIRELEGDDHYGVRAYGSAISSISAYPHVLTSPRELRRLPAIGDKICLLLQEFIATGTLEEAESLENDEELRVRNLFFKIWGCGHATAKKFWKIGYRTLDDLVNYHWKELTRDQQVGLKYYEDFLLPIPRAEVECIGKVVLDTANDIWEGAGFQLLIVGSYRRGKEESGDVDVILSHPDGRATGGFIDHLIGELEEREYITTTMKIIRSNSERGQTPVSLKHDSEQSGRGAGFDTLDKANVTWQDPNWPSKEIDIAKALAESKDTSEEEEEPDLSKLNPNPYRRVDIIISPWKTVGCAVAGWSSGTTFQRDLRRYCRKVRDVKFDSSGLRRISGDGSWVDLEGRVGSDGVDRGEKGGMVEAERRVFEGLGLVWITPEERCTG